MSDHGWIIVERWDEFQTYDTKRGSGAPPWIKVYTRLLDDENYLDLSAKRRALLHGIWLLYAASGGKVSASSGRLGARLGLWSGADEDRRGRSSVRREDLVALEQAGFIRIVARELSSSKAQSDDASRAREEVEVEVERASQVEGVVRPLDSTSPPAEDQETNGTNALDRTLPSWEPRAL